MRKTLLFSLCLGAFVAILFVAWKSSNFSKVPQTEIDIAKVDSILIGTSKLSDDKAKQFAEDWNDAKPVGPCKYIATYLLTVYQKDGTQRHFRANGKTIKEKNDSGFRMKEEDYFAKLLESTK